MNHREAFKRTKSYYGITGSDLHRQTGVSQNHISEFINNKSKISTEVLDSLVDGMEELASGARLFYIQELMGKNIKLNCDPKILVNSMDDQDISDLMFAIASKMSNNQRRDSAGEELAVTY